MYTAITKYDINKLRLNIIKGEIMDQYDTFDEFRLAIYPQIKLNTFRQWFKKPYYISDQRLCNMEQALGISEQILTSRLVSEFDLSFEALSKTKGIQLPT